MLGLENLIARISATSIDGEASRWSVFSIGFNEFKNFFLFGYGYGGFEILYRLKHDNYLTFYNHVHNDFIQFLGEWGFVGIILFTFWIYQLIKTFFKNYKSNIYEINMIVICALTVTFIHGNLDFALHIPGNFYLLILILGLSQTKIKRSI